MTKKVAILYSGAKYWGGIENYLTNLFDNYDKKKIELCLISMGEWELTKRLEKKKVKVFYVPSKYYRFKSVIDVRDVAEREKVDLLVGMRLVDMFYVRLVTALAGIPNLVTVHSNYEYDYDGSKRVLYWLTDHLFRSYTTKYIAVSKYLKTRLEKSGIKRSKITVIYNGVDGINPVNKERGKIVRIGSLGRLHFTKGYHQLIRAISLLSNYDVKLNIWGEGEDEHPLNEEIHKLGLSNKVVLRGFKENIAEAFRETDIYIQPSLAEGFGLTVAEAMLAERPIIVSPAGSLTEIIEDGKTGLVTKGVTPESLAASIKVLIEDEKYAKTLAKNARLEALEKFSVKRFADETVAAYLEVIK